MTLSLLCFLSAHPHTSLSSLHWISNTVSKNVAILMLTIVILKYDSSEGSMNSRDSRYSAISLQHVRNQTPHGEKSHREKQIGNQISSNCYFPLLEIQFQISSDSNSLNWVCNLFVFFARWFAIFPSVLSYRVTNTKGLNFFPRIHIF